MSIFTLSMSDSCVFDMVVLGAKTRLSFARVYVYRYSLHVLTYASHGLSFARVYVYRCKTIFFLVLDHRLSFARVYVYRLRVGKPAKPPLLCKEEESIAGNDYLCETTSGKQCGDECIISS